jgi:CRISPR-associated protein (TIGR03984 family)
MTEQICWGTTEKLSTIVQALDCPPELLMMLERVPTAFLSDDEQKPGICLQKYDASENLEAWERGRIFHNNFELRWEKQGGVFVIVYIGEPTELPMPHIKSLSEFEIQDETYYLWGERVSAGNLKRIGQPETANLFLELQIPRLLPYPVSNRGGKSRVKISARHYLNLETGDLEFYRFRYLEEVS